MADAGANNRVGVLGATSFVGACLLTLLAEAGWQVTAFSRRTIGRPGDGVEWRQLASPESLSDETTDEATDKTTSHLTNPANNAGKVIGYPPAGVGGVEWWVCVAPIWVLPDYFGLLEKQGARRVVVLSSTSRFTKDSSSDTKEQAIAHRLAEAETRVREWAESRGVEWVILRPTLIYGLGRDKNIVEIARFIRRFGFFPLFGKANGLRQPVHAEDVAGACFAALRSPCAANRAYNISGGETLAYRDMVTRVFSALDRRPHLLNVPLWAFRLAVAALRCLPRYRKWSTAMAERMNQNLVFDHGEAARDLSFKPRAFVLAAEDLPA